MKIKKWVLAAVLTLTAVLVAAAVSFAAPHPNRIYERPPDDECGYYSALASRLQCRNDNYLIAFGNHYCRYFIKHDENYSYSGLVVLQKIRRCLIGALQQGDEAGLTKNNSAARPGESSAPLTCENVGPFALQSHAACYIDNDFCTLGPLDQTRIAVGLRREIFSREFQPVIQTILSHCANHPAVAQP